MFAIEFVITSPTSWIEYELGFLLECSTYNSHQFSKQRRHARLHMRECGTILQTQTHIFTHTSTLKFTANNLTYLTPQTLIHGYPRDTALHPLLRHGVGHCCCAPHGGGREEDILCVARRLARLHLRTHAHTQKQTPSWVFSQCYFAMMRTYTLTHSCDVFTHDTEI